jgi:hypothetical protein
MRSFYLRIRLFAIEIDAFYRAYPLIYILGLLICEFVICETYFTVPIYRIYNEVRLYFRLLDMFLLWDLEPNSKCFLINLYNFFSFKKTDTKRKKEGQMVWAEMEARKWIWRKKVSRTLEQLARPCSGTDLQILELQGNNRSQFFNK